MGADHCPLLLSQLSAASLPLCTNLVSASATLGRKGLAEVRSNVGCACMAVLGAG